jgi:fluoride exporter
VNEIDPPRLAAIVCGGAVGALARTALVDRVDVSAGGWPWPTFIANVAGALLLGYLATRLQERLPPSTYRRSFAAIGLCGALTTFSTFQVELIRIARDGHPLLAGCYGGASMLAGFAALAAATLAVRRASFLV